MDIQRAGVFRGCHVFDTHEATFYLNEAGSIVGLQSEKMKDGILGVLTGKSVQGHIGNPVVYAIENMNLTVDATEHIFGELNITYAGRIERILHEAYESRLAA